MLKFNYRTLILCSIIFLNLGGCSSQRNVLMGNVDSLQGLKMMAYSKNNTLVDNKSMGKIRQMALKETALSLGAQSGLAYRAKQIDEQLNHQDRQLDKVFNFEALMLNQNVLPPVLLEGRNTLNLANEHAIRISDRTYKIYKQARFATTAPNWRQYLWMDYQRPERPNKTLLPKDKQERQVWDHYVELGWRNGIEQANTILGDNLARIKEDYTGMILYRKLLAMNMVTPPYVSHTDLGITGNSNEMHIDDRVLRITALPGLNINSKQWKAALSRHDEQLKRFKAMQKLAAKTDVVVTSNAWQPVISPVIDAKN